MKDKIKRFFIDKKELLVFIAVVLVVFATVITIASLALSDVPVNSDEPIVEPDNNEDDTPNVDEPNNEKPQEVIQKFMVPLNGEYEVIRTFFDINLSDEELVSAVISNGSYMIESKGISYAKADNSVFEVLAIYEGTVVEVLEDELEGTTVTIKHSDDVTSVYSSLANVTVKTGDEIMIGQVIGQASTSLMDVEAGVHVHLEVKVNNSYVNPNNVFGKTMDELDTDK